MENKSVRWQSAAASALLLGSLLTACSSGDNNTNTATDTANTANPSDTSNSAQQDADAKQTVTVSVFTEDRFLEDAVSRFEQSHPNIDIEVQETVPTDTSGKQMIRRAGPGDDGPPAGDVDKYVNAVGAALMSGKGSDLISVGYLPVDRYLDKGMFADWSELAGKDKSFNSADYYEKVLKGMTGSTGWYAIPVGYTLEVLMGNKSAIQDAGGVDDKTWNWEQFIALCEKISKQASANGESPLVLGGQKPEDLMGFLTETVYGKLVSKDGNQSSFDEEAFRVYLEQVKKLYDSGAVSADDLGRMQQVFSKMSMSQPMELASLPSAQENGEAVVLNPPGTGEDEGLPFTSDLAFALNARSKVKPAAWEFVKFLLSKEIQAAPSMMAFPVNQAAAKEKLEQFVEMQKSGKVKMMIKDKNGPERSLTITPEQIDSVLQLLPTVGKYQRKDDKVIGMIKEEAAAYFAGSKSSEAVAKAAANRIDTYLNE
ncbi:carbohydrate ABC transporter substrate-binding protein [Paenibacillus rhizovicinus]|uniref:Carbohydrate ABC transporter substrate-binding protein n=1 Tax=Paenibacillus rhizovicinus TaxID=2704463 RepID=A0A6C0P6F8_9BACL|nr:ABC transporter substrate-binding protein [Paenibacillus rhizovicinus]QHW34015.1 carbohydrate ABC transporter substrate-binding protein [Paenibacillus rhizovicinus]